MKGRDVALAMLDILSTVFVFRAAIEAMAGTEIGGPLKQANLLEKFLRSF